MLWEFSNSTLESEHDYIQWMFPTVEKSMFNADAPDFPDNVQKTFREDEQIRANLRKSFKVFLAFLGLELANGGGVSRGKDFEERARNWLDVSMLGLNHNFLRCTRVLHCLRLAGHDDLAQDFFKALEQIHKDGLMRNTQTMAFWREAAIGKLQTASEQESRKLPTERQPPSTLPPEPNGCFRCFRRRKYETN
jgi:hypothetical protein